MEQIWSISLSQMVPSTSFCVKSCPCHLEELQYLSQGRPKIWCWSVQTYLLSSMQLCSPSLKETFFCSVIVLSSFPDRSAGKKKKSSCNAGDRGEAGSIPGSGRSPGGGNDHPLQYSCLGNPMIRGAWRAVVQKVVKIRTQLFVLGCCIYLWLKRSSVLFLVFNCIKL